MNRDTAITEYGLNATNQITPDGSLTYSQNGTWADGTPRFTATTSLNPGAQGIYDTNQRTEAGMANIAEQQTQKIGELLNTPINLDNEATEARLWDLGSKRLTPQFAQDDAALRTKLANSGIRQGSAAWDAEMSRLGQNQNDARNQLLLSGRGQAIQELLTERNQPLNEISALTSGSQVSMPNFVGTPQTNVAGVDYAGMVNSNYQAQVAQSNASSGGLFGLAGTALGAGLKYGLPLMSDRRTKTDISRVGTLDNGLPVYSYRYKSGGPMQIGLMADEVENIHPDAIVMMGDLKAVDYARAVESA